MINFVQKDIFSTDVEALVNTVNTVGVMGKGVALIMKEQYPLNFRLYQKACKEDRVKLGSLFVTRTEQAIGPKYIINFPTKGHWRESSRLNYISTGLDELVKVILELNIKSIAMPPLGCGNGGLDWSQVKPLIIEKLSPVADRVEVNVTVPGNYSFSRKSMKGEFKLTKSRALIYRIALRYSVLDFDITHLEIQKLAYFIQEFGQTELNLRFEKGVYGPYSSDLKHLVAHLEGDYFVGQIRFQDMAPTDPLTIQKSIESRVEDYIKKEFTRSDLELMERLSDFITGFESPSGLELLSTVHWAFMKTESGSLSEVQEFVNSWSYRKAQIFSSDQISIALERIQSYFVK